MGIPEVFVKLIKMKYLKDIPQAFTKFENRVESLTDGMQIHLLCSRELLSIDYKNKLVNMAVIVIKNACETSSIF